MTGPAQPPATPTTRFSLSEFVGVARSEWTKLWSVRSTYWSILAAFVVALGLSTAISFGAASSYHTLDAEDRATFDVVAISLAGLFFAQLAIGVLASLNITAEFSTGMIRTSLAAVPRRGVLLAAKGLVVATTALVLGVVISLGAFFLAQIAFHHYGFHVSLSDHGVLRAVIGGALYLGVLTLFAIGLGTIIRSSAGSITVLVGLIFVLPAVSGAFPQSWQHNFARFLPANAGSAILAVVPSPDSLSPWAGFGVFCGWAALALGVGYVLLRRRDV